MHSVLVDDSKPVEWRPAGPCVSSQTVDFRPLPDARADKAQYFRQLDEFQVALQKRLQGFYEHTAHAKLLALKVCNSFAAQYHFQHQHARLSSRPTQLMIDPANSCQLRCPGCVHSANQAWAGDFDWPRGVMSTSQADQILTNYGPFACAAVLYNYGEPLLFKAFPELVSAAADLGLYTMTSTNLSLRIDAARLVASGLNRITVSADGATQQSYQRFRRRGRLDTVLHNLEQIIAAKREQQSDTPYVIWQYLCFEHNVDEIDRALSLAQEMGVNEIQFATPFSVAADDPTVRPASAAYARTHVFQPEGQLSLPKALAAPPAAAVQRIELAFAESWMDRLAAAGPALDPASSGGSACGWLYHNLTFDALGRVMPCCMAPTHSEKTLVYAKVEQSPTQVINSYRAVQSRERRASKDFDPNLRTALWTAQPYCESCDESPTPPYSFRVTDQLRKLDPLGALPSQVLQAIEQASLFTSAQ